MAGTTAASSPTPTPDADPSAESGPAAVPAADPAPDRPPRRPRRAVRLVGRLALVAVLLVVAAGAAWGLLLASRPGADRAGSGKPRFVVPEQQVEPRSVVPGGAGGVPDPLASTSAQPRASGVQPQASAVQPLSTADPFTTWVNRVADATDIPVRAVRAYATAELLMRARDPACRIGWSTLAGIGRVESIHGQYGGASLGADGRESTPIVGVPLDGSPGVKAIPDTDGGALDGDTTWDRAVGPMQFLPSTWQRWGARASGDGAPPDPQNIDDAALTAARYLCAAGGGDMTTPQGWWDAVLAYNRSVEYGQKVFSGADAYAKASTGSN
ncbi:lysozyme family protein [Goodfellowiella coeruleoviolacea]|uniref:lytic murein transglycosylase n=1 Tax=Goodfellowiella coeruleoviolacea TaxID=334858 RepID=UPI0020A5B12E|nr:lytic murein transglycosylase [Goodfellowiella coeruleoviolacea]